MRLVVLMKVLFLVNVVELAQALVLVKIARLGMGAFFIQVLCYMMASSLVTMLSLVLILVLVLMALEFYQDEGQWHRLPHIGTVIIEDNVQIAALNCIARGCIGDTIIPRNTIIDTLNHFAHNCHIGKNVAITASNVFAGSVTIKDIVQISGQVAVNPQTTVGTNTVLMARSGVTKDIADNQVVSGFPAVDHKVELKYRAQLKQIIKNHVNNS